MKISHAAWKTSVEEEQDVPLGNPFKPVPLRLSGSLTCTN